MRTPRFVAGLALFACLPAVAQRTPVPLNDYTRLGQRFTATRALEAVRVCVPSWSDNEGGLTLTLWDSPARKRALAGRTLTGVRDNEMVELKPARPLAAGPYYWEIADRTGTTRIGLYCDALPADTDDCAYLDGKADPKRRFLFEVVGVALPRPSVDSLVRTLRSGTPEQKVEACRLLAVFGTPAAVPALARLLPDPALSHLARYALEDLPARSVDEAFRTALDTLTGDLLIGVINSVAVRRDAGAAGRLIELLHATDQEVAKAAAVALGRIGTPAAAEALVAALDRPASPLTPALYEAGLSCASRLYESDHAGESVALFDRLLATPEPAVRRAAAHGAVLARGAEGLELLCKLLHSVDDDVRGAALWVVQQAMPGRGTTQAVAAELGGLVTDSQVLLIAALAGRGDVAALPTLELATTTGAKVTRLAAVVALPKFGGDAVPCLLGLLDDGELREATENALASLPRKDAAAVAGRLLRSREAAKRRIAVGLVHRLRLAGFGPALAAALEDSSPEVRLAAAAGLEELAGVDQVVPLRDALLVTTEAAEAEALEGALSAACVRAGDPDAMAEQVLAGMAQATPPRRAALLRVLGAVGGARALQAVKDAVAGPAGEVRSAALDVLCGWPTDDAAADLLRLAREPAAPDEGLRCLRGVLRLAAGGDVAADRRLALCREANDLVQRDEEKKLLLSALGGIPSLDALALAVPYLAADGTKEEACAAIVGIADKLIKGTEAARLAGPLEQAAKATANADLAKQAQALLEQAKQAQ